VFQFKTDVTGNLIQAFWLAGILLTFGKIEKMHFVIQELFTILTKASDNNFFIVEAALSQFLSLSYFYSWKKSLKLAGRTSVLIERMCVTPKQIKSTRDLFFFWRNFIYLMTFIRDLWL
jgi:hypothetical protein